MIGLTIFSIPIEEVFFFIVQTFNTSVLYLICSKPTLQPVLLMDTTEHGSQGRPPDDRIDAGRTGGSMTLLGVIIASFGGLIIDGRWTYMSLILAWSGPVLLFLWSVAKIFAYVCVLILLRYSSSRFMTRLPRGNIVVPIGLSTLYLFIVDSLSIRQGIWNIGAPTKLGFQIWSGLDIE